VHPEYPDVHSILSKNIKIPQFDAQIIGKKTIKNDEDDNDPKNPTVGGTTEYAATIPLKLTNRSWNNSFFS